MGMSTGGQADTLGIRICGGCQTPVNSSTYKTASLRRKCGTQLGKKTGQRSQRKEFYPC